MGIYIAYRENDGDSLTHYGVKGMKWHKHLFGKDDEKSFRRDDKLNRDLSDLSGETAMDRRAEMAVASARKVDGLSSNTAINRARKKVADKRWDGAERVIDRHVAVNAPGLHPVRGASAQADSYNKAVKADRQDRVLRKADRALIRNGALNKMASGSVTRQHQARTNSSTTNDHRNVLSEYQAELAANSKRTKYPSGSKKAR